MVLYDKQNNLEKSKLIFIYQFKKTTAECDVVVSNYRNIEYVFRNAAYPVAAK
jgi:hypothetical protein